MPPGGAHPDLHTNSLLSFDRENVKQLALYEFMVNLALTI